MKKDKRLFYCPFCGNRSVRFVVGIGVTENQYMITCDYCTATVSFEDGTDKGTCAERWNKRV